MKRAFFGLIILFFVSHSYAFDFVDRAFDPDETILDLPSSPKFRSALKYLGLGALECSLGYCAFQLSHREFPRTPIQFRCNYDGILSTEKYCQIVGEVPDDLNRELVEAIGNDIWTGLTYAANGNLNLTPPPKIERELHFALADFGLFCKGLYDIGNGLIDLCHYYFE
jgi:hypothetical protein